MDFEYLRTEWLCPCTDFTTFGKVCHGTYLPSYLVMPESSLVLNGDNASRTEVGKTKSDTYIDVILSVYL